MSTKKSKHIKLQIPTPSPAGKEVISVYESIALAVTDMKLADVVQLFVLPAGCVPVSYIIGATDMDTGTPAFTAHFGLLNVGETAVSTAAADGGAAWITSLALSGTAAITQSDASKASYDILKSVTASSVDRILALVVAVIPATAAAGTVTCEFAYKAAN
jgi:hypothetical protein